MSLITLYVSVILLIILVYEFSKILVMWVSKEIRILWKEWQKVRIAQKSIVIEIDEDEIEATHVAKSPHSKNTTSPRTHTTTSPSVFLQVEARVVELEAKLSRIEEAFGWNLDSQNRQPITVARINESNLTYIVVVETPEDNEENLLPGHQNPRAIRPRFVKRPEKLNEY